LNDDGSAAAKRLYERVRSPLLTDITVDWAGLDVSEVYPKRIPDLFGAKPVVISGRYTKPGQGTIRLIGKRSGSEVVRPIRVDLPAQEPKHDVLATVWARHKVEDLMGQDWAGLQSGTPRGDLKESITQLGLDYRLVTQFTSFVAVEETTVIEGGQPRRIEVPVEMPEGVSHEGVFGAQAEAVAFAPRSYFKSGGVIGGIIGRAQMAAPPPPPVREAPYPAPQRIRTADAGRDAIRAKLHPDLAAIVDKLRSGATVKGKAEIQVTLSDASPASITKLKNLGFEVVVPVNSAKTVIGRIPFEALAALAELDVVRYVSPATLR
jgi:Ca-activated chloride channel family protein